MLRIAAILVLAVVLPRADAFCQDQQNPDSLGSRLKPVEVDFLFSYYEQDGIHSAVTGGSGTELLNDIAGKVIVNVPLDSASRLTVSMHLNHYTSASSDRINPIISSASVSDYHTETQLDYTKTSAQKRQQLGVTAGGASETDYISANIGLHWAQTSKDGNRELALRGQAFFDAILLIFPDEVRGTGIDQIDTDKRRTFNLAATLSQVLSKRIQASISTEAVLQTGLLSTSFHRVYFVGEYLPRLEELPRFRLKFPVSARLNVFPFDFVVIRGFARFYLDTWGITSYTAQLELPVKILPSLTIYPHYRYYRQTAANYFAAFGLHSAGETFYSSDYDLSAFYSNKFGLGLQYSPLRGIWKFQAFRRRSKFKSFDFRYSRYLRSDGLHSGQFTVDFGFEIW